MGKLLFVVIFMAFAVNLFAEEVTITTYYPAPEGVYHTIIADEIGIGTPDPEAIFEVNSTTDGILIPRMTMGERNNIYLPPTSLLIYQTDDQPNNPHGYYYYDTYIPGWAQLLDSGGGGGWWDSDNDIDIYNTNTGNVGIGTTSPLARLSIADGAILASGTVGDLPISGAGRRLMWVPGVGAFRAGEVYGDQWDTGNLGTNSFAVGYGTKATASASVAMGDSTTASAPYAFATGSGSTASGYRSTAMGYGATASAESSVAMGRGAEASAEAAIALGRGTAYEKMTNNVANSFAVGFLSNIPTLFVGPSNGVNTSGNVGIGITTPNSTLEVKGSFATAVKVIQNASQWNDGIGNNNIIINNYNTTGYLMLPESGSYRGRQYIIINQATQVLHVRATGGGYLLKDLTGATRLGVDLDPGDGITIVAPYDSPSYMYWITIDAVGSPTFWN